MADDVVYVGIGAAARAVGIPRSQVARLLDRGFLKPIGKGGTSRVGGRPAFLIARKDLEAALVAREKWHRPAEKQPARRGRPRQASPRQRAKASARLYAEKKRIVRHFLNAGRRQVKYRGKFPNRKQR